MRMGQRKPTDAEREEVARDWFERGGWDFTHIEIVHSTRPGGKPHQYRVAYGKCEKGHENKRPLYQITAETATHHCRKCHGKIARTKRTHADREVIAEKFFRGLHPEGQWKYKEVVKGVPGNPGLYSVVGSCPNRHEVRTSLRSPMPKTYTCPVCAEIRREKEAEEAFEGIGGEFYHLSNDDERLTAEGRCENGHHISVAIGKLSRTGLSCTTCAKNSRLGVIYCVASKDAVYIGQTVNLALRMRGHLDSTSNWSGGLFRGLPASQIQRILGVKCAADEIGGDDMAVIKRAIRSTRKAAEEGPGSQNYFTILDYGFPIEDIGKHEKHYIDALTEAGVPLVNRNMNPQYSSGQYIWGVVTEDGNIYPNQSFNAGAMAAFILAGTEPYDA